jgi:hypothetical protein
MKVDSLLKAAQSILSESAPSPSTKRVLNDVIKLSDEELESFITLLAKHFLNDKQHASSAQTTGYFLNKASIEWKRR